MVLVSVRLFFEVSVIEEHGGGHQQSLVFLGGFIGEVDNEVGGFRNHSSSAARGFLLESGDDFTRGALDFEIDGLASIARSLAVETELAAAGFENVSHNTIFTIDFHNDVTAGPDILNVL